MPAELASEFSAYERRVWRLVEGQHLVSTLKLVDTLAEQSLLENLIEETKPPVPVECQHLHWLLSTPFRYGAEYPRGSRFRRKGRTLGVYYASEEPRTAVAELVFYRLLFFLESPETPWPTNPADYTAFTVAVASPRSIDLTKPPLVEDKDAWCLLMDYAPCQALADAAREAETEVILYESVRDREGGVNVAVLKCVAFAESQPLDRQTWRILLSSWGAYAMCESPLVQIEFDRNAFAADSRIAMALTWDR